MFKGVAILPSRVHYNYGRGKSRRGLSVSALARSCSRQTYRITWQSERSETPNNRRPSHSDIQRNRPACRLWQPAKGSCEVQCRAYEMHPQEECREVDPEVLSEENTPARMESIRVNLRGFPYGSGLHAALHWWTCTRVGVPRLTLTSQVQKNQKAM